MIDVLTPENLNEIHTSFDFMPFCCQYYSLSSIITRWYIQWSFLVQSWIGVNKYGFQCDQISISRWQQ